MTITTAGESHGKCLVAILEGIPAGLSVDFNAIDRALAARQSGYGRGARQAIEQDRVEILSGVRNCVTIGSPIALAVRNRDYENWKEYTAPEGCDTEAKRLVSVRPGHADLAGMLKFGLDDARSVAERASARETATRVAAGEICRQFLAELGVEIASFVRSIGQICDDSVYPFDALLQNSSETGMLNLALSEKVKAEIDGCKQSGDTLGGAVEIRVKGLKSGFGSCMIAREKLDSRLAGALFSVQSVKGVEVGLGFQASTLRGSDVHDEIFYDETRGYYRKTNRAGGIEGGMSNGEEIVLRVALKPIPTLARGLQTVNTDTKEAQTAAKERGDVCAVPAASVVLEGVVAAELAAAVLERLGGDTMDQVRARYREIAV